MGPLGGQVPQEAGGRRKEVDARQTPLLSVYHHHHHHRWLVLSSSMPPSSSSMAGSAHTLARPTFFAPLSTVFSLFLRHIIHTALFLCIHRFCLSVCLPHLRYSLIPPLLYRKATVAQTKGYNEYIAQERMTFGREEQGSSMYLLFQTDGLARTARDRSIDGQKPRGVDGIARPARHYVARSPPLAYRESSRIKRWLVDGEAHLCVKNTRSTGQLNARERR